MHCSSFFFVLLAILLFVQLFALLFALLFFVLLATLLATLLFSLLFVLLLELHNWLFWNLLRALCVVRFIEICCLLWAYWHIFADL